jgi:hypothetical protein
MRRITLVKAVFLDIDGTLMDTNYLHLEAWAQAFEEVGARAPGLCVHSGAHLPRGAVGRQWKRAIQVILGVGSGIALASFLVLVVGAGPLQMTLVVGLALGAAVFLGAEPLLMTQVGISAITAVGVEAPSVGLFSPERLLDALVGACVAVIHQRAIPGRPRAQDRAVGATDLR